MVICFGFRLYVGTGRFENCLLIYGIFWWQLARSTVSRNSSIFCITSRPEGLQDSGMEVEPGRPLVFRDRRCSSLFSDLGL